MCSTHHQQDGRHIGLNQFRQGLCRFIGQHNAQIPAQHSDQIIDHSQDVRYDQDHYLNMVVNISQVVQVYLVLPNQLHGQRNHIAMLAQDHGIPFFQDTTNRQPVLPRLHIFQLFQVMVKQLFNPNTANLLAIQIVMEVLCQPITVQALRL